MSYWSEPDEQYYEVDENFEFNTVINKLIESEVEKRVKDKIENYDFAIEREMKSRQTVSDLENKLRAAKRDLEDAEKTFKKEGSDEKAREILGGYKLGDTVWFKKVDHKRKKCETCLGDRKVIAEFNGEEVKIECPDCKGMGSTYDSTSTAENGVIKQIKINTWYHGKHLEVEMWIEPKSYRSHDSVSTKLGYFFATKEECEASMKKDEEKKK